MKKGNAFLTIAALSAAICTPEASQENIAATHPGSRRVFNYTMQRTNSPLKYYSFHAKQRSLPATHPLLVVIQSPVQDKFGNQSGAGTQGNLDDQMQQKSVVMNKLSRELDTAWTAFYHATASGDMKQTSHMMHDDWHNLSKTDSFAESKPRDRNINVLVSSTSYQQGKVNLTMTPQSSPIQEATRTLSTSLSLNVITAKNEIHIRLSQNKIVNCFLETLVTKAESGGKKSIFIKPEPIQIYREVYALKGSVFMEFNFEKDQLHNLNKGCQELGDIYFSEYCCALQVRVPRGLYIAMAIREHNGSKVRLFDTQWTRELVDDFEVKRDNFGHSRIFAGSSNVVNIIQSMQPYLHGKVNRLYLQFQAVDTPDLQIKRTAMNKGVVQTVLYDILTDMLNPLRNPWVYVSVPSSHMIMVSCPTFNRLILRVVLYAGDRGNETLANIDFRHLNEPCANIYNTSLLYVYFRYLKKNAQSGFKLQFSFHNQSTLPTKLADSSWNCSVPFLLDFMHHLSCNKAVECRGAADEANCSYTSDRCGPGYLTMGGACFFYVWRTRSRITWNEADDVCSLRGGRLAVINTPDKWNDAIRLLPNTRDGPVLIFVGIRNTPFSLPPWYTGIYQWSDATTALYLHSGNSNQCRFYRSNSKTTCGYLCIYIHLFEDVIENNYKRGDMCPEIGCQLEIPADILCEKTFTSKSTIKSITIKGTGRWPPDITYVECPMGHYTHQFLSCDVRSSCWLRQDSLRCGSPLTPLPPSFACSDQKHHVPYTLVCDHHSDCVDGSDEDFCDVSRCRPDEFSCDNAQCILSSKICDGWEDCLAGEDEGKCETEYDVQTTIPPPALVSLHDGHLVVKPMDSSFSTNYGLCPYTHFQCPNTEYCLPSILRCNGAYDCPGREDEVDCEACPGFYRCRASKVCLQHRELCDGHPHCPQHDDELMCNATCPVSCVCRGLAFFCKHNFATSAYPLLRFLNASGSAITPAHLNDNRLLIHLILANCGLTSLYGLFLPNLLILDAQDNQLISLSSLHLVGMPQLRALSVAGNPLALVFQDTELQSFPHVVRLDLSRVQLHDFNVNVLSAFPKLRVLNLSHTAVQRVQGHGFRSVENLREIDLRGCPMKWFPRGLFQGLVKLQAVYASSFKVCCHKVLPSDFNIRNCFAPSDEISSCEDLLRGNGYGISVFVLSLLALAGNAVCFIFRTFISKRDTKLGYGNFVTHLSMSDFLMGVYLAIIGVSNQVYRGTYLWNDESWRHSVFCKLAGFLSLLSSETSVLIICLITLDRFVVLRFPFSPMHFTPKSAHVASVIVWISGVFLASVPLLPITSHWEFYSQTGICIPLPITRKDFAGQTYSFSLLIVFNFIVFVLISLGQLSIYSSVSTNSISVSNTTKKTKDLSVARRLITVAMTDFLCWFPIGILGLMASNNIPISGEVNVAVAVFVLPLNATVNPGLYTFNIIMERRSRGREGKLRALLLEELETLN